MLQIKERIGKMLEYLSEQRYPRTIEISNYKMIRTDERFSDAAAVDTSGWEEFSRGQLWGGHREYYWFETEVCIPEAFAGERVVYELKTGREGGWDATNPQFSIYVNGRLIQGLDVNHREVLLTECAQAGERFQILLSAFTGDQNFRLQLDSALKTLDRKTERYYYDLEVPYRTVCLLAEDDPAYLEVLPVLNESLNLLDFRKEGSDAYYESLDGAQEYLSRELYQKRCHGEQLPVMYCVGHTHIDCAWLWTLRVTEDKAVRSFSTVLELMRQYPEYLFMSSQPQLYQYVKKNAPEIYGQIRQRVQEGRWEPEGGMFVEADCNLASGESLARQFLYGKRFFKKEFGVDNVILWLPDVFGYSAALPQIMQKCGLKYFMTTKISWNEFNKMPYDTFEWEGIDGSRVLTHFVPTRDYHKGAVEGGFETEHFTSYNGYLNPSQIKGGWKRYSQKDLNQEALCCFGFGDGGGGPTRDMLENHKRLMQGIPGAPRTKMSAARQFFETLEEHVRNKKNLPLWVGELYLEYHRGTYTSMARNKRYNRKSEFAYQNAEFYAFLDQAVCGSAYPEERLRSGWETILKNQFHDILPGSSIREVYEDSQREYENILKDGGDILRTALGHLTEAIQAPVQPSIQSSLDSLVVFQPNSKTAADLVSFVLPKTGAAYGEAFNETSGGVSYEVYDGEERLPVQRAADGAWIFTAKSLPGKGYKTFTVKAAAASAASSDCASAGEHFMEPSRELRVSERSHSMENAYFQLIWTGQGEFAQIYDKRAKRQVLKPGQAGNVMVSYEDRPHNYDAWDVNCYYTEKSWPVDQVTSMEIIERGPVRATLRIEKSYLDSVIVQYVSLYRDLPRIDIRNEIDWKEHQIFLKNYFPVDVHTNEATFDIQYGNVKRDTHNNTSWDAAKFEVCHHKWADVSEDGYGVSILNDCKYGISVRNGVIGLSMLKSAVYPNPEADKEHHTFTYSIYPHIGGWQQAGTAAQAYQLNNPCIPVWKKAGKSQETLQPEASFVLSSQENVVIEAVKKAEDSKELIVRVYECCNRRTQASLTFLWELSAAVECNMLEEVEEAVANGAAKTAADALDQASGGAGADTGIKEAAGMEWKGNQIFFEIKPYEIKTFKLSLRTNH